MVPFDVVERLEAAGQRRGDELRGEFVADLFALRVEEAPGGEDRAGGQTHPARLLHPRQQRGGDRRGFAVFLLDRVLGGDDDAGPAQRLAEDFVEGGEDRVGEDVGAGDEGDAEDDGEDRRQGPHLARPETLQGEAGHSRFCSSITSSAEPGAASLTIFPSCRVTRRSAWAAAAGSWVTITTVWPKSSTAPRSSRRTSALAFESRLPVGSSAKTTAGLLTSARATATRCCWPPESSAGRWVRRSSSPTVRTRVSIHCRSGLRPAIESGSTRFSSAVKTGIRLKNWKTKPSLSRRSSVSAESSSPVMSTPSSSTVPEVGLSSPARMCISVDLPDPEGPMIAVKRSRSKLVLTPARASTAASPSPKRRWRSVATTTGPLTLTARHGIAPALYPARVPLADRFNGLLIDLDGVIWVGREPVPGSVEALRALLGAGKRIVFVTNNPGRLPEAYAERLQGLGVAVEPGQIVTAGVAEARLAGEAGGAGGTALVLGDAPLKEMVAATGARLLEGPDAEEADVVVVSGHGGFDYGELKTAKFALDCGARLFATSHDPTMPYPGGRPPGRGAVLAAGD